MGADPRHCVGMTRPRPPLPGRSLAERFPQVADSWHPELNGNLTPFDVSAKSAFQAWWICPDCGYEWQTRVAHRADGKGCGRCAGNTPDLTVRSLAVVNPELAAQWHPSLNGALTPSAVAAWSNHRAWWKCSAGHEWDARVCWRSRHSGCPVCSSRRLDPEANSLTVVRPDIAAEWHPTKNGKLTPSDVFSRSNAPAWWRCRHNSEHEWCAPPGQRTRAGRGGCPECSLAASSKIEQRLRRWLAVSGTVRNVHPAPNAVLPIPWRKQTSMRVDALAEDVRTGRPVVLEYDGSYWHSTKAEVDTAKTKALLSAGALAVRVREQPLPLLDINHPRLLQLSMPWSGDDTPLVGVLDAVERWLHP